MKLSPETVDALSLQAKEYYNPAQPYHNWGHAVEVADDAAMLLDRGGAKAAQVSRDLMRIAAAWHDAGHDHARAREFESKEHYSVYLLHRSLDNQLPKAELDEIEEAILGTRFAVARTSMLAVALHYGDVGNMAHTYPDFYDHTVRLWTEYGRPEWEAWRVGAGKVIEKTASEADRELPIIGINDNTFQSQVHFNLEQLMRESEPGR